MEDRIGSEFESLIQKCKSWAQDLAESKGRGSNPLTLQLGKRSLGSGTRRSKASTSYVLEVIDKELELDRLMADAELAEAKADVEKARVKAEILKKQAEIRAIKRKLESLGSEHISPKCFVVI